MPVDEAQAYQSTDIEDISKVDDLGKGTTDINEVRRQQYSN